MTIRTGLAQWAANAYARATPWLRESGMSKVDPCELRSLDRTKAGMAKIACTASKPWASYDHCGMCSSRSGANIGPYT